MSFLFNTIKNKCVIQETQRDIKQEHKKQFDSFILHKVDNDLLYFY